jgi:hypothetical protein
MLRNIAHLDHLGGALAGYVFIKMFFSRYILWDIIPKSLKRRSPYKAPSGWSFTGGGEGNTPGASSEAPVSQKELDRLLDKISMHGINSLSEDELERLRKARNQMREES